MTARWVAAVLLSCALAGENGARAQALDFEVAGTPLAPAPADPAITAALASISPERMQQTVQTLVNFKTRSTLSSMETDLKPGTGVLAAADWIHEQFAAIAKSCGSCLEVKDDVFVYTPPASQPSRYPQPTKLHNVYAILRGADPQQARRMYLVTGHYDTRVTSIENDHDFAPGANDDSSGTAVSLECARVLAGMRLPATVVFVAVAGEEQGLTGSEHLAARAKAEGWQLEGVLNNDIVGGDTTPGETLQDKELVRVFSQGVLPESPPEELRAALLTGAENDTPSRELARAVLAVAATYMESRPHGGALRPIMELRLDRYLRGGDHSMFSAEGFPAVRFTEWRENFNHQHQDVRVENGVQYGDLLQFDDFAYMARVARLNAAVLLTLANSPGVPHDVRLSTRVLDNNSTLRWTAPTAGAPGVRYEIVWRPTSENDWRYGADAARYPVAAASGAAASTGVVANTLGATVPVSKDNVFFGVRACDTRGHCSQAVAPTPER